jgi:hypothetical protein
LNALPAVNFTVFAAGMVMAAPVEKEPKPII